MTETCNSENELKYIAWTSCSIDGKSYVVKYIFLQNSYHFMISDLVYLYQEELSESEIQGRCENLNPGIEMSVERVVKQIKKSVEDCLNPCGPSNIRNTISVAKQSLQCMELKVESYVAQILFVWFFTVTSLEPSSVSTHFLLPLIGMVTELKRRNQELVQIIKKKDEEIEDYKTNGAKVTRKRLETKPFVESEFVAEMDKPQYLLESIKEPIKTVLTDSLYCKVVSAQETLKRKAKEIEDNVAVKRVPDAKKVTQHQEVLSEDSGIKNREEEMQRRVLLQQQLDMKIQKKTKKKVLKL